MVRDNNKTDISYHYFYDYILIWVRWTDLFYITNKHHAQGIFDTIAFFDIEDSIHNEFLTSKHQNLTKLKLWEI
jgi:hypothetical protein